MWQIFSSTAVHPCSLGETERGVAKRESASRPTSIVRLAHGSKRRSLVEFQRVRGDCRLPDLDEIAIRIAHVAAQL